MGHTVCFPNLCKRGPVHIGAEVRVFLDALQRFDVVKPLQVFCKEPEDLRRVLLIVIPSEGEDRRADCQIPDVRRSRQGCPHIVPMFKPFSGVIPGIYFQPPIEVKIRDDELQVCPETFLHPFSDRSDRGTELVQTNCPTDGEHRLVFRQ